MDEFLILLQAKLDEASLKGVKGNLDELKKEFEELKMRPVIDQQALSNIVKQLESIAGKKITIPNIEFNARQAVKDTQQLGKQITDSFNQNTKQILLDKEINKQVNSLMESFGIHGKNAFNEIKNALIGYRQELLNTTSSTKAFDDIFDLFADNSSNIDKVTSAIANNMKVANDAKSVYQSLIEYISQTNKSGSKIYIPNSIKSEYGKDFNGMRSILGSAFTSDIKYKNSLDFENFVTELNSQLGNVIDMSHGAEAAFSDLVNKVKSTKGSNYLSANELFGMGYLNKSEMISQIDSCIDSINQSEKELAQQSNIATDKVVQNEERKQQAYQETANAYKSISSKESIVKSGAGVLTFEGTNNAAKEAQQYFRNLLKDEQAVIATTEQFGQNNNLTSFTVNIKRASGEVESLKYTIDTLKDSEGNIEQIFYKLSGSSINDSGAIKQIKAIENAFANFTQKIEQFKSTNSSKLSGLTTPLLDFESKLIGLKNGTHSIDEVSNAFKLLQAEAAKIDAPLKRQLSTFDSYKNAVDKGKESISGYRAELKGLANTPKELSQELTKASKLLLQINRTEATEGTTANWSNQAREFVDLLETIKNKILVIKKEQSANASSSVMSKADVDNLLHVQKILNTVSVTEKEVRGMLSKQGFTNIKISGIEDTNGKVEKLTVTANAASGALEKFDMVRQEVQGGGSGQKIQDWLVQSGDVQIIKSVTTAQEELASSVKTTSENFSTLKSKWEEQGVLVGEFKSKVEQMESSLASVGSKGELNGLKTKIQSLKNEASTIAQANKIQLSIETGGYESKVDSLIAKTQQWTDVNGNARISATALSTALDNLGNASKALSSNNTVENQKALIAAEKELDLQVQKVTNSIKTMNSETMKSSAVDSLRQKYQEFYDKNGAAHRRWGMQLKQAMIELASGAEISKQRGEELKQELIQIQNAARQAGKLGKSGLQKLFEGFKSFGYWTSSTFLVMKAIQSIKGGLGTVKALDTALVDLKKTTTMTNSELEDFYYSSNKVAKQMGVTTEEIINQAAAWSRLGFSSEAMATKMAKYSSMFASISPGLDLDSATDGLVSTMKAFSIGLDNADDVVDGIMSKINIIGNSKALNNSDIVDFLTRSSSALASANNSIEESIAMGEAIVEITRDAAGAGQVMKTTSMRIRGYDEEVEAYTEELENLKGEIADLTKTAKTPGGISLFTDETKETYKSTYKILEEISTIWNDLTDKNQAQLLEVLAGKRNGQALAALISNFESAQESMDLMANSAGNAEAEMSVIMDKLNCPYVQKCA